LATAEPLWWWWATSALSFPAFLWANKATKREKQTYFLIEADNSKFGRHDAVPAVSRRTMTA
jgi:hypothetical protein